MKIADRETKSNDEKNGKSLVLILIYTIYYNKVKRLFQHLVDNQYIRIRENWLPNSRLLRITISTILKAFEDLVQVELLKVRWEEIKRLTIMPSVVTT